MINYDHDDFNQYPIIICPNCEADEGLSVWRNESLALQPYVPVKQTKGTARLS